MGLFDVFPGESAWNESVLRAGAVPTLGAAEVNALPVTSQFTGFKGHYISIELTDLLSAVGGTGSQGPMGPTGAGLAPSGSLLVSSSATPPAGYSAAPVDLIFWKATASGNPTARAYFSVSEVDGKIYAIGGGDSGNISVATVEQYDPITNAWTAKASMPTARRGMATVAVDGKIYAVGKG